MLDLELASRITIITNRALCGGEAALLARIVDFATAGVGEIVVREKDLDEVAYAALFGKILRACKSGFCADMARKHSTATDETRPKNFACVLDEILSENFTGAANCANDSAPGEISLRGVVCETKSATEGVWGTENAESMQGAQSTENANDVHSVKNAGSSNSAQYAENSESKEGVENLQSVKGEENSQSAEGAQSAESARRLPAIFMHNFADFALRAGERNLWLPLGVLRSFSAVRGTEFLRANFKKLVASCHSEAEAREALKLGASAICLSHIFATDCKAGLAPKGLNLIRAVRGFYGGEIYALGGITPRNFVSVLRAGADRIAVMSSVMTARDASDFIRKFKK
ncbi:thiamine phosphate synthase [uncultured Campylobacter sp.]|uniref:thiamine phosphate synthase n=1 Tax=uncultured Campylobacter sp. TaxID=218934 RepID=UPI00262A0BF5|nr:thiamine phosphate synthase [uncultured Campylobacter sp.]